MAWNLQWGKDKEHLISLAEDGQGIPAALLTEPELLPYQAELLHAFMCLCWDRPIGMGGVGGVGTLAVFAMADEIGEDRGVFLALCREMDGVYLEHVNASKK